ncbi:MAG TPA: CBS domain-containing protein [Terriglobales bacterium]|nr:CBS domain-containing protein [Terriglobales bacterium]
MTSNPVCAQADTTVEEIATMMKSENIGCVPVMDEDEVIGVITDRDIVVRCIASGKDPAECRAEDILSEQAVVASPEMDSQEAARLMSESQIRRLPVMEGNRLVGMLSLGDVAVKEDNDRLSGDVLQDVSEGVKGTSSPAADDSNRGQGISNHDAKEEIKRQEKVIPFREKQDNQERGENVARKQGNKRVS